MPHKGVVKIKSAWTLNIVAVWAIRYSFLVLHKPKFNGLLANCVQAVVLFTRRIGRIQSYESVAWFYCL